MSDAVPRDGMPAVQADGKGRGVQITRVLPASDRRPQIGAHHSGQGVNMQRKEFANGTGRISAPFP